MKEVQIESTWKQALADFWETDTWAQLSLFVREAYKNTTVYPKPNDIFKAFELTPFDQVKVVILGQDPYHGPGQAHGLCFSVADGITPPPSLKNIYKEIESDLGIKKDFESGNLEAWAKQGVFLLNAILSVEASKPASHRDKGWEEMTDLIIQKLSDEREGLVFMLWGKFAESKAGMIDFTKHLILTAPHPSPFSVHKGFFGCKHFSQCNEYLKKNGQEPIEW